MAAFLQESTTRTGAHSGRLPGRGTVTGKHNQDRDRSAKMSWNAKEIARPVPERDGNNK